MFRFKAVAFSMMLFLFTSTAAMGAHGEGNKAVSGVVTAAEVKEQMAGKNKTAIIDVRSLTEYKYNHIPGAVNIPRPGLKTLTSRLPKDKSTPIIIYARGDSHSDVDSAFNTLSKMGYTNVRLLRGGMLEWLDNHYPVHKGSRP